MPDDMRRDGLGRQTGTGRDRALDRLFEKVLDPITRERGAPRAGERHVRGVGPQLVKPSASQPYGVGPQRDRPLLAPFPDELDAGKLGKTDLPLL